MMVNSRQRFRWRFARAIGTLALAIVSPAIAGSASPGFFAAPPAQGSQTKGQAGDLFSEIYRRSLEKQKTMTSIRASFTETTESTLLTRPLVAHGSVVATSSAKVLMTYSDPERKTLTMDGKTLVVSWPDRREREQISIVEVQKRIEHYFASGNINDLRSMFDITAKADPSATRTDRVEMRPKRKQIRQGLELLELWIDQESMLMTRMRMTFPGGDRKTFALDNITLNVPVSEEMFRAK
jgi:outer membrane lipoprotein-sorting protein